MRREPADAECLAMILFLPNSALFMNSEVKWLSVDELRERIAPIAEKHGVDSIVLFGSAARGDHNDGGDYDFCIEPGAIRDYFMLGSFYEDMEEVVGRGIDIVNAQSVNPGFMKKIRKEGILVYSK
jgi:predicted nucleotidyltransferase